MAHSERLTVYLPLELLSELHAEADRQSKPINRLVQIAWALSRKQLRELRPPTEFAREPQR